MAKVGPRDKKACVLAVDFKNKRLQYVGVFRADKSLSDTQGCMNSSMSKYFIFCYNTRKLLFLSSVCMYLSLIAFTITFLAYIFVERGVKEYLVTYFASWPMSRKKGKLHICHYFDLLTGICH
jgi:hypothetical protein